MNGTLALLTLYVLAVFRVSRLITHDRFPPVAWLRRRLVGRRPSGHWLRYALGDDTTTGCPWCVGVWVAGCGVLVLVLTNAIPHWSALEFLMLWPASAAISAIVTTLLDLVDDARGALQRSGTPRANTRTPTLSWPPDRSTV